jgi:hypothetical protein
MASEARVVPFQREVKDLVVLMDTGKDSVFMWYGYGESRDRSPEAVKVHKHDDVDETIILLDGEGYYLHGPTLEDVVKTPWEAPCVIWRSADDYHRIVTTSAGARESILMYTAARTYVDPFNIMFKRAIIGGDVAFAALPVVPLDRHPEYLESTRITGERTLTGGDVEFTKLPAVPRNRRPENVKIVDNNERGR